jgi:glycosyltransferase involved in cell wall biosynthesis
MKKRGHSVDIFGPDDYMPLPNFPFIKRLRLFLGYFCKSLQEVFRSYDYYDVVELWGSVGWMSILFFSLFKKRQFCLVSRSNGLEPYWRTCSQPKIPYSIFRLLTHKFESKLDALGFKSADALTVVSGFDLLFAKKNAYQPNKRLLCIENPLPDHWLKLEVKDLPQKVTFGFIGSWVQRKGIDELIDIINRIYVINPSVSWIISGVGSQGKACLKDKTQIDCSNVYESMAKESLKALYYDMTLLLSISSYESFGLACAEAMACGRLLVSTNVGFMNSLKDGHEFISIQKNDISDIIEKLMFAAANPSECTRIALNGWKRIQCLKWSTAGTEIEKFYENLVPRNSNPDIGSTFR